MTDNPPETRSEAEQRDREDELNRFRRQFRLPEQGNGELTTYLCGHSLGPQPQNVRGDIERELDRWGRKGVKGHFQGNPPWMDYAEQFETPLADLTGALREEVVAMNTLTTNLHLLLISFYNPEPSGRHKILLGPSPFPSDRRAAETQIHQRGLSPETALVTPDRESAIDCTTADILEAIDRHAPELATVLLSPVHYRTGRSFDVETIAEAVGQTGAVLGLDLAHSIGNIPLDLHDWGIDFAAWCSYKYLNGGPGAIAGCFVHERHAELSERPRLEGWWGDEPDLRFDPDRFSAQSGAKGWQLSNPPVLSMVPLRASLEIFSRADPRRRREKSREMTEMVFESIEPVSGMRILTPEAPSKRGAQVSISLSSPAEAEACLEFLEERGIVCDHRPPDIIRAAFAPLYNTYVDAWRFGTACRKFARTSH